MKYVRYRLSEMKQISETSFIETLFQHTENRKIRQSTLEDKAKIDSWKDCRIFLQRYITQRDIDRIGDVSICFEYKIFDGTWIDAIIVCQDKLIILEFKSGTDSRQEVLDGHLSQLNGYYNKITKCNRVIWEELKRNRGFTVEKYLIYTNPKMVGKTADENYIKVDSQFRDVLDQITSSTSETRITELLEFKEELDITTTGVMRNILNRRVLSDMYVQDNNVQACAAIVDRALAGADDNALALNLVFIKGAPGTGKTGTGLSLLEKYMNIGAKYVTGNGNLSKIFAQMIKEDDISGTEAAVVGSLHDLYNVSDFCNKHKNGQHIRFSGCPNKLLIIDEAQRIWNPIQIATAKKNQLSDDQKEFVIKNEVSEAMLVLRAVLQDLYRNKTSHTVVFLMGSGQEIYIGEEDGEAYIEKAVRHITGVVRQLTIDIKINIYVPTEIMYGTYCDLGDTCKLVSGLLLQEGKRNEAQDFVNELLEDSSKMVSKCSRDAFYIYDDYRALLNAISQFNTKALSIGIVGCGFETETEWINGYYGKKEPRQYLNLNNKKVWNIQNSDLLDFFVNKTCNELDTFSSQFNCQGLELDYVIMIWGSMMVWRTDHWELSKQKIWAVDNYCKNLEGLKHKYPALSAISINKKGVQDTFIRNSYRVLLTRARISTYVYVEDPETYNYLKSIL